MASDPARSLVSSARKARLRAKAEYSGFKVRAALQTNGRKIYSGCNIENASYGLTVCAERVALLKAVSEGVQKFRALFGGRHRCREADTTLRRLSAAPMGVLRGYRRPPGQPQGENEDLPTSGATSPPLRQASSLKARAVGPPASAQGFGLVPPKSIGT